MSAQFGQHLRELAPERRTRQPGRDITGWVEVDAVAQQSAIPRVRRFQLPPAMVSLEVPAHLSKGDALVSDDVGSQYVPDARGVPAEIDLVFHQLGAHIG